MRYAAIDIGTNSTRLLVAELRGSALEPICRDLKTTRLGSGLMASGILPQKGKAATSEAVSQFINQAKGLGAKYITVFATSALRVARDGRAFAASLSESVCHPVEIISEEVEAYFSYLGVKKSLPAIKDALVFDLGGGSCELIWHVNNRLSSLSLKIGAVYLTDKFFSQDPPSQKEVAACRAYLSQSLQESDFVCQPIIGVGGTVTTLAAMAQSLSIYDPSLVHGYVLSRETINRRLEKMLALTIRQRQGLPGIRADRAEILPAGTLVIDALLEKCQAESLTVSEGDILLGSLYASALA